MCVGINYHYLQGRNIKILRSGKIYMLAGSRKNIMLRCLGFKYMFGENKLKILINVISEFGGSKDVTSSFEKVTAEITIFRVNP